MKRRRILQFAGAALLCIVAACGFDGIATSDGPGGGVPDGGTRDGTRDDDGASGSEGGSNGEGGADGGTDAPLAETGTDAGLVSHVDPSSYDLAATNVESFTGGSIDTSQLTINGATRPTFKVDPSGVAVWSVASLSVTGGMNVQGTRALVIVSAGDVNINELVDLNASHETPAPGSAATGSGAGGNGSGLNGGGGGGRATPGGIGGGGGGGAAGGAVGDTPVLLGGFGGGQGGGANGNCGRPGAGGGAIQISAAGKITIGGTAGRIEVAGGGGRGGCETGLTGGGGGGSGGTVFLEATNGIEIKSGPSIHIDARGGGGGEGGGNGDDGNLGDDGHAQNIPAVANGGTGRPGGNGGNGGNATTAAMPGATGTSPGGGGGAVGSLFVRVKTGAPILLTGTIVAGVVTLPSF
jgi:hypothetical protein